MSVSISIYSIREVTSTLHMLQSIAERVQSLATKAVKTLINHLSRLVGQRDYVSKEKVELIFWIHKAFIVGFVLALAFKEIA